MIKKTNTCPAKLIAPFLNNYYENENKNESPTSDSTISVKNIIKPKPLNIKSLTELNNRAFDKKEDIPQANLNFYGKLYKQKLYKSNSSFSK